MTKPFVSVCVPTYNAEATLAGTLETLLAQTYDNLEIIVCDNASSDGTLSVARSFRDSRIHIVTHAEMISAEGNFERCMSIGRGAYTCIYHADDLYDPGIVEREVAFLEAHPRAGAVFSRCRFVDERGAGDALSLLPPALRRSEAGTEMDFATAFRLVLRYGNFVVCPAVMARTAVYRDEVRTWADPRFGSSADLDVWFRILERHTMGCLPQPLLGYRRGSTSFSVNYNRLRTSEADYLRVLENYVHRRDVRAWLRPEDLRAYDRLRRRHDVVRANNALLQGDRGLARRLAASSMSGDAFAAALRGGRDLRVLMALVAVRVGLRAPRFVRPVLEYVARRGG